MTQRDLSGQRFGRLTAIREAGKNKQGNTLWYCVCDCGGNTTTINSNLTRGNSKSCGCISREKTTQRNTKYLHSGSHLYTVWRSMMARCYTKTNSVYRYYGGGGISVCDRWHSYENFYTDMAGGYENGLTIDRIDCSGDYEPANCRWVTMLKQANNKRNTKTVTAFGVTASLAEICRENGADYKKTWKRLWRGWSIEDALTV